MKNTVKSEVLKTFQSENVLMYASYSWVPIDKGALLI